MQNYFVLKEHVKEKTIWIHQSGVFRVYYDSKAQLKNVNSEKIQGRFIKIPDAPPFYVTSLNLFNIFLYYKEH